MHYNACAMESLKNIHYDHVILMKVDSYYYYMIKIVERVKTLKVCCDCKLHKYINIIVLFDYECNG